MNATSTRPRWKPPAPSTTPCLHVAGVGMRIDHVPAAALWERMRTGVVDETDRPERASSLNEYLRVNEMFRGATLRGALRHRDKKNFFQRFVDNYAIPTVPSLPPTALAAAARDEWRQHYQERLLWQLHNGVGMPHNSLGFPAPFRFEANGLSHWIDVFQAFDQQGDLNSALMWAEDGYAVRATLGGWENERGEPLESIVRRDRRPGELRDALAGVLVLRPEAAEWLYEWSLHVVDASQRTQLGNGMVAESMHGFGGLERRSGDLYGNYVLPYSQFTPTPNVPEPWSQAQYTQYAAVPTLAFLHRPQVASFPPGASADQRADGLEAAIRAAIIEGLQSQTPKRGFYCAATGGDELMLLSRSLAKVAPEINPFAHGQGFHVERWLGDTGAASTGAAIGMASMCAWETGEAALVMQLRSADVAAVFAVQAPPAEYRAGFHPHPYVS